MKVLIALVAGAAFGFYAMAAAVVTQPSVLEKAVEAQRNYLAAKKA